MTRFTFEGSRMNKLQGPEYENMEANSWPKESGASLNHHVNGICQTPVELARNFSLEVTSGKDEVMAKMKERDIFLDTPVKVQDNEKTAMKMCLEDINDGHEVIKEVLDKLVIKNEESGIIKVNVGKLYRSNPEIQSKIVTELIAVRESKTKDSRAFNTLTNLLKHPVISAFIMEKWKRAKLFFTIHTRMYMFFLLLYTLFMFLTIMRRFPVAYLCENYLDTTWSDNCNSSSTYQQDCTIRPSDNTKMNCTCDMIICVKDWYGPDWSSVILTFVLIICILEAVKQGFKFWQKMDASATSIAPKNKKIEAYIKAVNMVGLVLVGIVLAVAIVVDRQNITVCHYFNPRPFLFEWDNGFSVLEFLFILSALYLCIKEVLNENFLLSAIYLCFKEGFKVQYIHQSLSYHKDPKKLLEWIALISAFVAMGYKEVEITTNENGWTAGITALGISSGWMAFVFKMGEPRFSVFGNFITMNYNILKKIYSYLLAIVYTITGFALGFWILEHKLRKNVYHFNGPFDFEMTSITMAMGEFGFREGFQEAFKDNWVVAGFSMMLLFFMIVTVTITMLNLLLASIIKDHEGMLKEVYVENLVFMANYINIMETVVYESKITSSIIGKSKCMKSFYEDTLHLEENHFGKYCSNKLCSEDCENNYHIEQHYDTLIEELEKIVLSGETTSNDSMCKHCGHSPSNSPPTPRIRSVQ